MDLATARDLLNTATDDLNDARRAYAKAVATDGADEDAAFSAVLDAQHVHEGALIDYVNAEGFDPEAEHPEGVAEFIAPAETF